MTAPDPDVMPIAESGALVAARDAVTRIDPGDSTGDYQLIVALQAIAKTQLAIAESLARREPPRVILR